MMKVYVVALAEAKGDVRVDLFRTREALRGTYGLDEIPDLALAASETTPGLRVPAGLADELVLSVGEVRG